MNDFEEGFLLGILVGEGHFGGDGLQPQVTLRMHVRHEELFRWLVAKRPGLKAVWPVPSWRQGLLSVDGPRQGAERGVVAASQASTWMMWMRMSEERIMTMIDRYKLEA